MFAQHLGAVFVITVKFAHTSQNGYTPQMTVKKNDVCLPGDVWSTLCPSREVLDMIADKWTVLIIHALSKGTLRHNEIARKLGDISQKVLTHDLRKLERSGVISRKVFPIIPPRVEYTLTPLGISLVATLEVLTKWSEANYPAVVRSRKQFDDANIK